MAVASASLVPKVRASPVHRAMRPHPRAVPRLKALHVLKARAMAAVTADAMATAMERGAKSNVVIPVLTTVAMARAVPHRVVRVLKAVARPVVHKAARVLVAKTAAATTVTSCHATLTR